MSLFSDKLLEAGQQAQWNSPVYDTQGVAPHYDVEEDEDAGTISKLGHRLLGGLEGFGGDALKGIGTYLDYLDEKGRESSYIDSIRDSDGGYLKDAGDWFINNGQYLSNDATTMRQKYGSGDKYADKSLGELLTDPDYLFSSDGAIGDAMEGVGSALPFIALNYLIPGSGLVSRGLKGASGLDRIIYGLAKTPEARKEAMKILATGEGRETLAGLARQQGLNAGDNAARRAAMWALDKGAGTAGDNALKWAYSAGPMDALTNAAGMYDDLKEQGYSYEDMVKAMGTSAKEELPLDMLNMALFGTVTKGTVGNLLKGTAKPKKIIGNLLGLPIEGLSEDYQEAMQQRLNNKYTGKEYGTWDNPTPDEAAAGAQGFIGSLLPGAFGTGMGIRHSFKGQDDRATRIGTAWDNIRSLNGEPPMTNSAMDMIAEANASTNAKLAAENAAAQKAAEQATAQPAFAVAEPPTGGDDGGAGAGGADGLDVGFGKYDGQRMDNGANGCVEAVTKMGASYSPFLAQELSKGVVYVPTLVQDAGDAVIPFSPENVERGDIIVYGDDDHVVTADGNGGYYGNSTSQQKVLHGDDYTAMGGLQPTKIIKTGGGGLNAGVSMSGGSADVSSLPYGNIAMAISQRTGIPAQFVWAQMAWETGDFSSGLSVDDHNYGGIKRNDGSGEYRHFDSDEDYIDYASKNLNAYKENGIGNAKTIDEFAAALHDGGYFTDDLGHYTEGLKAKLAANGLPESGSGRASSSASSSTNFLNEKSSFDINSDDAEGRKMIADFIDYWGNRANVDDADTIQGMLDANGKFRNTQENRDTVREKWGDELQQYADSHMPDEQKQAEQMQKRDAEAARDIAAPNKRAAKQGTAAIDIRTPELDAAKEAYDRAVYEAYQNPTPENKARALALHNAYADLLEQAEQQQADAQAAEPSAAQPTQLSKQADQPIAHAAPNTEQPAPNTAHPQAEAASPTSSSEATATQAESPQPKMETTPPAAQNAAQPTNTQQPQAAPTNAQQPTAQTQASPTTATPTATQPTAPAQAKARTAQTTQTSQLTAQAAPIEQAKAPNVPKNEPQNAQQNSQAPAQPQTPTMDAQQATKQQNALPQSAQTSQQANPQMSPAEQRARAAKEQRLQKELETNATLDQIERGQQLEAAAKQASVALPKGMAGALHRGQAPAIAQATELLQRKGVSLPTVEASGSTVYGKAESNNGWGSTERARFHRKLKKARAGLKKQKPKSKDERELVNSIDKAYQDIQDALEGLKNGTMSAKDAGHLIWKRHGEVASKWQNTKNKKRYLGTRGAYENAFNDATTEVHYASVEAGEDNSRSTEEPTVDPVTSKQVMQGYRDAIDEIVDDYYKGELTAEESHIEMERTLEKAQGEPESRAREEDQQAFDEYVTQKENEVAEDNRQKLDGHIRDLLRKGQKPFEEETKTPDTAATNVEAMAWIDAHPFRYDKNKSVDENIERGEAYARAFIKQFGTTDQIDTPERQALRERIADELYGKGAKKKEGKVWLIVGVPASGKSTIANPIQEKNGAMLIDADEAKEKLPEFAGGLLAGAVHEESSNIVSDVLKHAMEQKDNIVMPVVGKTYESLKHKIDRFKEAGYEVHLEYVDLPVEKATQRVKSRFVETGRLVSPKYLASVGLKPKENYDKLKVTEEVDSYEAWNNDVERGAAPLLIERSSQSKPQNSSGLGGRRDDGRSVRQGAGLRDRESEAEASNRVKPNTESRSDDQGGFSLAHLAEKAPVGGAVGKAVTVVTDKKTELHARYRIVPASALTTSNVYDGDTIARNGDYPQPLQPRERSGRKEMQVQTDGMAADLHPADLEASRNLNQGAPLIRKDGVVLNGNGRTMAITRAYQLRNASGKAYTRYLCEHAEDFGFTKAQMQAAVKAKGTDKPVLVRELLDDVDDATMTEIINSKTGGASMSASEQATTDAKSITASDFDGYDVESGGDLTKASNDDFVARLLRKLAGKDELNRYTDKNGGINQDGYQRVKRAIFSRAYSDADLIAKMAESMDDAIKNISNGLQAAAANIARLNLKMKEEHAYNYPLAKTIAQAVKKYNAIKEGKAEANVEAYTSENATSLTGGDPEEVVKMVQALDDYHRSGKKVGIFLNRLARLIDGMGSPKEDENALFAGGEAEPRTLAALIDRAKELTDTKGEQNLYGEKKTSIEEAKEAHARSVAELRREIASAFPGAKDVHELKDGGMAFTMPNGAKMEIRLPDSIELSPEEEARARRDHGAKDGVSITVNGYEVTVGKDTLIALAKNGERGTVYHEVLHVAMETLFNAREKAALAKKFGKGRGTVEEHIAEAFRCYKLAREHGAHVPFGKLFQRIQDFFANLADHYKELRGTMTDADVARRAFRELANGKAWERDAGEGRGARKFAGEANADENPVDNRNGQNDNEGEERARFIDRLLNEKVPENGRTSIDSDVKDGIARFGKEITPENVEDVFDSLHCVRMLRATFNDNGRMQNYANGLDYAQKMAAYMYGYARRCFENDERIKRQLALRGTSVGRPAEVRDAHAEGRPGRAGEGTPRNGGQALQGTSLAKHGNVKALQELYDKLVDEAYHGKQYSVSRSDNQDGFSRAQNPRKYSIAYHGTQHEFDQFDVGKIGSGEGSQVHGWGIYFAKDRKISEGYRDLLSDNEHKGMLAEVEVPDDDVLLDEQKNGAEQPKGVRKALHAIVEDIQKSIDKMHEVDKVLADKSKSLNERLGFEAEDRDALLSDEKTLLNRVAAARTESDDKALGIYNWITMFEPLEDGRSGKEIYEKLSQLFGGDDRASRILNEYGVKGIKYNGHRDGDCYVVFDDKAVSIIRKLSASRAKEARARAMEDIKAEVLKAFPGAKDVRDTGDRITFTMPNGAKVAIRIHDNMTVTDEEAARARRAHGIADGVTITVNGSEYTIGRQAVIDLSQRGEVGTVYHEALHVAMDLLFDDKTKAALMKKYGSEEKIADAYRKFMLAEARGGHVPFGKPLRAIRDFFRALAAHIAPIRKACGDAWTAQKAFEDLASGKAWEPASKKSHGLSLFSHAEAAERPIDNEAARGDNEGEKSEVRKLISDERLLNHVKDTQTVEQIREMCFARDKRDILRMTRKVERLIAAKDPRAPIFRKVLKRIVAIVNQHRRDFYERDNIERLEEGLRRHNKGREGSRLAESLSEVRRHLDERGLEGLDDWSQSAVIPGEAKSRHPILQEIQQELLQEETNEHRNYSVSRSDDQDGSSHAQTEEEEKQREKIMLEEDAKDPSRDINLKQYIAASPSRVAEKVKTFRVLYVMADRAMNKVVSLRDGFERKLNKALALASSKDDRQDLFDLLLRGDAEGKEWTRQELIDDGVKENVADAYIQIRRQLNRAYHLVNDARRKPTPKSETVDKDRLAFLKANKFVTDLSVKDKDDGKYLVSYKEYKNYPKTYKEISADMVERFQNDPGIQVVDVKEAKTESGHAITDADGEPLYDVTTTEGPAELHKLKGYIPHFFHEYFLRVVDSDGNSRTIGSARNQREAVMQAEAWMKDHKLADGETIHVQPKVFDINKALGVSDDDFAPVMGDKDFLRVQKNLAKQNDMTLAEAKDMLDGAVRLKGRHRFFGNALHRTGAAGFETDLDWALRHYFNSASRYVAMETEFKPKAISYFERVFGAFDKDYNNNLLAKYCKDYINDINGTPSSLEQAISKALNSTWLFKKVVIPTFGDRAALTLGNGIANKISYMTLGLNMSSALLNFSQLMNSAAYIGDVRSLGQMMRKGMHRGYSLHELRILKETGVLNNIGIDSGSGYDKLRGGGTPSLGTGKIARTLTGVNRGVDFLGQKSMYFFQQADAICRRGTVLVAYEKARKEGKPHAEAIAYAKDVNNKANFQYGTQDAPNIFRRGSIVSQLALQFKKYGFKELEVMADFSPWSKKTSRKQKLMFWGMYALLCGAMGVPALDWLDEIFGEKTGFYTKDELQKAIIHLCGGNKRLAVSLMYGIPAAFNINLSSRAGMSDVIPTSLGDFAGPTISKSVRLAQDLLGGDYANALRDVNPGLYNLYAAGTGESRGKRDRLNDRYVTAWDRILRAVGFRSVDETIPTDMQRIISREKSAATKERQEAQDAYIKDPTSENKQRLKDLGIKEKDVQKEATKKNQTREERTQGTVPKKDKDKYKSLTDFMKE